MVGAEGSSARNYYQRLDKQYENGLKFRFPTKPASTTEKVIEEMQTAKVEYSLKVQEIITDLFSPNNTSNDSRNVFIDEIPQVNSTATISNRTTSLINDIFNSTTPTLLDTTENPNVTVQNIPTVPTTTSTFDYITTTISDIITPTVKEDGNFTTEHDMYTNYHNTTFIIMGCLIGILIIIGIILVAVYLSYKKRNSADMNAMYHSEASREIPTTNLQDLDVTIVDRKYGKY